MTLPSPLVPKKSTNIPCMTLVEAGADYELPDKVIYYVF